MFECEVCGLLSLGGNSCPACGSLLRKDLTLDLEEEDFGEVPGLDDAVDSFYNFEGTEPPEQIERFKEDDTSSSLPFGFRGQSNVVIPGLPFGIGSYSTGMPFDMSDDSESVEENDESPQIEIRLNRVATEITPAPSKEPTLVEEINLPPFVDSAHIEEERPIQIESKVDLIGVDFLDEINIELPHLDVSEPDFMTQDIDETPHQVDTIEAPKTVHEQVVVHPEVVRISGARILQEPMESNDVPDYWKIDAEIPDYESIYNDAQQVVEMEYTSLVDDVVIYDHNIESTNVIYHSPLEHSAVTQQPLLESIEFELHPSQAMAIDLAERNDLAHLVQQGFTAFQSGQWIEAAQSFQRLASEFPQQPAVFNNYGIALFERAKELDATPGSDHLASSQYDSSILALREAAKLAPQQSEILLNLSSALFVSGRAEKALNIANVHNQQHPMSLQGQNAAAVFMHSLGQEIQAKQLLSSISQFDEIALTNLRKMN